MEKAFALLELLQDGSVHSGQHIGESLGVTRSAVWHHVKRLQDEGVEIHAVSGKGYRLLGGYEFLNSVAIESAIGAHRRSDIREILVDRVTDSTNQRLLDCAAHDNIHGLVRLAEFQSRGRGRRGGTWLAPPGSGLCMSLGWRFDTPPPTLSALGLVVGIALIRALERYNGQEVFLKWPNDVYHNERKLAGILIEMRSEFGGPSTVVIGMGINMSLSNDALARIDERASDVCSACRGSVSRNVFAATVIDELIGVLQTFERDGFDPFLAEWRRYDMLLDRAIKLQTPDRQVCGIARGVGPQGTLLIEHENQIESFLAGHIVFDESR